MRQARPTIIAGTRVGLKNRDLGTVALVLTDPATQAATQLVIRHGLFGSRRLIVPIDRIVDASSKRIVLDLRLDELAGLPEYRTDEQIAEPGARS
ncbi:MAG TPA: PRC-barrel domain-containing protein [Chloroflexota bacterium]|nr:PRC-barrel domain-containing protein [Chloroflexota bacterium]